MSDDESRSAGTERAEQPAAAPPAARTEADPAAGEDGAVVIPRTPADAEPAAPATERPAGAEPDTAEQSAHGDRTPTTPTHPGTTDRDERDAPTGHPSPAQPDGRTERGDAAAGDVAGQAPAQRDGAAERDGTAAPDVAGSAPARRGPSERDGGDGRDGDAGRDGSVELGADDEQPAGTEDDDAPTVVIGAEDRAPVRPAGDRFGGLLPAPGLPPRRPRAAEPAESPDEVETDETESTEEPPKHSMFGRRWPGGSRAAALIGILCGLLGFGLAVQVRSNTASNGLTGARQEDLVRILDDLSSREERLRTQIASLEAARARLTTTGDKNSAALNEAKTRSQALGILAGTLPAQGPGIVLTINDPKDKLQAEDLLDAVEELRAAGAEAIQVGPVRIGLDSSFTDDDANVIRADGQALAGPYRIIAIGEAATLATALNIPGGVVDTVRQAGGQAVIEQQEQVVIRVLRPLSTPHYAHPAE